MMAKQIVKVVPIRRRIHALLEVQRVANHAYKLWLANGFQRGTPEKALFISVRQWRKIMMSGLFLVPRHYSEGLTSSAHR
jgi:hypothetical protein